MKSLPVIAVSLALVISAPAYAQFPGVPKIPGLGGGGGASQSAGAPADIDSFMINAAEAEGLVGHSAALIINAIGTDEQIRAQEDKLKAAQAMQDPKERDAAVHKVEAEALVQTSKMDFEARTKAESGKLSEEKTRQLGAAVFNLALGLLKDRELYGQGQAIIANASSNPMSAVKLATKIGQVKDSVGLIGQQISYAPAIMGGLSKVMSVAKVDKLPTSTAEKPRAADL
jgi:hypothetical protein